MKSRRRVPVDSNGDGEAVRAVRVDQEEMEKMMKRFGKAAVLVVLAAGAAVGLATLGPVSAGARSMLPGGATLSINDQAAVEGNTATFTVSITRRQLYPVRVSWYTTNGTATAPADYATQSGNVVIAPWKYSVSFPVTSKSDAVAEGTEYFNVNITSPDIVVADSTGVFTLYDAPVVHVSNAAAVEEGNDLTYTFTLSHSLTVTATANYVVWQAAGSTPWVQGTDYTTPYPSTTVTFAPGVVTQTVTFKTLVDNNAAYDACGQHQEVWLHLKSATNAVLPYPTSPENGPYTDYTNPADLTDNWGLGTVPGVCATPTVHISNASTVNEGSDLTFTFTLGNMSNKTVAATYNVWQAAGSTPWVQGTDYTTPYPSTTVTFAPGVTTQTVTYHTLADCEASRDVTGSYQEVWLHLSSATNANLPYAYSPDPGPYSDYTNPADLTDNWGVGDVNGTNAGPCP
jgi:hypothetical protein